MSDDVTLTITVPKADLDELIGDGNMFGEGTKFIHPDNRTLEAVAVAYKAQLPRTVKVGDKVHIKATFTEADAEVIHVDEDIVVALDTRNSVWATKRYSDQSHVALFNALHSANLLAPWENQ